MEMHNQCYKLNVYIYCGINECITEYKPKGMQNNYCNISNHFL